MRWLLALLLSCSAEGPIAPHVDASVEDVTPIHSEPVSDDTAPGPCTRTSEVEIAGASVSIPIPCREFDERIDLGRPF
jgi:hypothetical protein